MYHLLLTQAEQICLAQEQVIESEAPKEPEPPQERKQRQKKPRKPGAERKPGRLPKFDWTDEAIQSLIDLRQEKVKNFKATNQPLSLQNLWLDVPAKLGVVNKLTADRACKKWNQLVKKYKDIQLKIESGTCSHEERAWKFSAQIRDILEEQWTFPKPPEDSEFDLVQLAYESRSTKHAKRVRSDIWLHFVKLNNKFARCRMCEKVFSYRSTVSNLRKHLLVMHLAAYANIPPPPKEAPIECENIRDVTEEKKKKKKGSGVEEPKVRRSAVWNYFKRLDDSYAECNVCQDTFSYRSSISNLMRHRRNVHPNHRTHFTPIRTFKRTGSKLLGPVKARPPEMKRSSSREATANDPSAENQATPSTDALHAVREEGSGVKPSYLWNFFTIIDKNFAECNICKNKFVYKAGMHNLARHQRKFHPLTPNSHFSTLSSENACEDDPVILPEDHPTIQITDVQSADTEEDDAKTETTDNDEGTQGRKYSYIWNFFRDLGGGRAECRVCKKVLSYRASVFNLMKHRQLVHPDQPSFRIVEEGGGKKVQDRQTPRRPKRERGHRPRSRVWQFFEYIDATYARCKMCRKELSHRYTSTNLLHHKNRMHPDTPLDYFTIAEAPPTESENDESSDDGGRADDPGFDPRDDDDDSSDNNRDADSRVDANSRVQEEVQVEPPPPPSIKVKRRKGEKWSSVWRLFERLDERSAKCKTCGRVYLHRSTNTNLRKHVRIRHPTVFRKFERLRNDYRKSKLFDECFPPPVFPDPPPKKAPPVTVSSATTSRRPEIVITIANSDQQSHAYGGDTPYTLPIIFIQEDGNKAKAHQPTAKMPPNNNNDPRYALNNMGGNYGHAAANNTFTAFESSGPVTIATGNTSCQNPMMGGHDPTLIQNIAHNSALIQNIVGTMGHNSNIIQNIAGNNDGHNPVLVQNMGGIIGHNPTVIQNMGGNIGHNQTVVQNVEYPAIAFDNHANLDMSVGSGQVTSGGQLVGGVNSGQVASGGPSGSSGGQVVSNDRLANMVKESNQLLRGMHSAIQRQSDVLCRLAESIDAMRARNREEMLTD